jgi:hypothetical protein
MLQAPQVKPISKMRTDHNVIMRLLKNGPVFLAQRGTLTAAMISIEEWNKIVNRLEEQQDIIDVLEAELELATGKEQFETVDLAELERMAYGDRVPA